MRNLIDKDETTKLLNEKFDELYENTKKGATEPSMDFYSGMNYATLIVASIEPVCELITCRDCAYADPTNSEVFPDQYICNMERYSINKGDHYCGYAKERNKKTSNTFEEDLHKMFSSIWDCEIDHPMFQDTVGELMEAVIQCYKNHQGDKHD